ncbi:MAG TPA: response regulator transcription factor [Nocardioidaceae bacterium]
MVGRPRVRDAAALRGTAPRAGGPGEAERGRPPGHLAGPARRPYGVEPPRRTPGPSGDLAGSPAQRQDRDQQQRATRIALVEDHALLAEALNVSLSIQGYDVAGIRLAPATQPFDLLGSILAARADVVILDLDLGPAGDGTRVIRPLMRADQRVVVLTASADPARWGACLARGALTVLPKTAPLHVIVDVVERVTHGLPVISRGQRDELVQLYLSRSNDEDERRKRLGRLTPREAHVLGELVHGKRVREVAQEAFVSEATVRTQVKSILAKLGVSSQLAAVAIARDAGWGAPER